MYRDIPAPCGYNVRNPDLADRGDIDSNQSVATHVTEHAVQGRRQAGCGQKHLLSLHQIAKDTRRNQGAGQSDQRTQPAYHEQQHPGRSDHRRYGN
jgi:hypothetical protein